MRSTYMPPNSHKTLETFESLVKRDLSKIKFKDKPKRYNLTQKEFGALKSIAENPSIICQKADKGGALVILDTEHYETAMLEHLNDGNTYARLEEDPTKKFMEVLKKIILKTAENGTINEKTKNFLLKKYPRSPTINIIPKIHKHPTNHPFRPIVNTRGSLHEAIGQFLDRYLQPSVEKMTTFIRDTTDFLVKLDQVQLTTDEVMEQTIMCTIDVKALYTSIPHQAGLEAVEAAIIRTEYEEDFKVFLLDILNFILWHSYFQ